MIPTHTGRARPISGIVTGLFAIAGLGPAHAADVELEDSEERAPIIEEFFLAETVYPQEQGELQLTLKPGYQGGGPEGDLGTVAVSAEYGITDNLQIEASWIAWQHLRETDEGEDRTASGSGDLELGVKYAFDRPSGSALQFAVGFDLTVPSGDVDRGLGEGLWVYEPYVIVSWDPDDETNLTLNLSYGFVDRDARADDDDEDGPAADELEMHLGLAHAFDAHWRGTLELSLETNEQTSHGDETELYVTPGVIYRVAPGLELGIGLPIGLNSDSADLGAIGLLTYEFGD